MHYFLLYAQEVLGIRQDITVICFALLQTNWYVDYISIARGRREGIKLSIPPERYHSKDLELVKLVDAIDTVLISDAIKSFARDYSINFDDQLRVSNLIIKTGLSENDQIVLSKKS